MPQLPAFCGPGSTISGTVSSPIPAIANQAGTTTNDDAVNALDATSWEDAPTQTLSCVIAGSAEAPALISGAAQTFEFPVRVTPIVPNQANIAEIAVSVSSGEQTVVADTADTDMVVSAAPKWDLSSTALRQKLILTRRS